MNARSSCPWGHILSVSILILRKKSSAGVNHDYAPTGECINLDITGVQGFIVQAFPGGADFGIVRFSDELAISRVEMSLWAQKMAEDGPEYIVRAPGRYERWYREYDITAALTPRRTRHDNGDLFHL